MDDLKVAWRKCMRRIMKVHPNTHCRFIPLLTEQTEIQELLFHRFSRFIDKCFISENTKVKTVTKLIELSRSSVSNNLCELHYREFCDIKV